MSEQRICNYINTNNHNSMRTSMCWSINIDVDVNMMACDRNNVCVGITLEFCLKNSIVKNISMNVNFSITGTMKSTVRRSISI